MTTTQRQALEAALAALESERIMAQDGQGNYTVEVTPKRIIDPIEQIKAALAEPEQGHDLRGIDAGPVSDWVHLRNHGCFPADELLIPLKSIPRYLAQNPNTSPREWQELSEEEISAMYRESGSEFLHVFEDDVSIISASLRAKNGG